MEIWKNREVVVRNTKVRTHIKCDTCGKIIADSTKGCRAYYRVVMQHNDWGNDSVDSIESYDACSKECLKPYFEQYLKECDKQDTMQICIEQTSVGKLEE